MCLKMLDGLHGFLSQKWDIFRFHGILIEFCDEIFKQAHSCLYSCVYGDGKKTFKNVRQFPTKSLAQRIYCVTVCVFISCFIL